jgi:hypothetical protein
MPNEPTVAAVCTSQKTPSDPFLPQTPRRSVVGGGTYGREKDGPRRERDVTQAFWGPGHYDYGMKCTKIVTYALFPGLLSCTVSAVDCRRSVCFVIAPKFHAPDFYARLSGATDRRMREVSVSQASHRRPSFFLSSRRHCLLLSPAVFALSIIHRSDLSLSSPQCYSRDSQQTREANKQP